MIRFTLLLILFFLSMCSIGHAQTEEWKPLIKENKRYFNDYPLVLNNVERSKGSLRLRLDNPREKDEDSYYIKFDRKKDSVTLNYTIKW